MIAKKKRKGPVHHKKRSERVSEGESRSDLVDRPARLEQERGERCELLAQRRPLRIGRRLGPKRAALPPLEATFHFLLHIRKSTTSRLFKSTSGERNGYQYALLFSWDEHRGACDLSSPLVTSRRGEKRPILSSTISPLGRDAPSNTLPSIPPGCREAAEAGKCAWAGVIRPGVGLRVDAAPPRL